MIKVINMSYAVVRIRGTVNVRSDLEDTMKMLGLKRKHSVAVLPETESIKGMIKKIDNFVAWGEVSTELAKRLKEKPNLKPPAKGFKSVKHRWPKGDLGYRGKDIEKLIERMM